MDRVYIWTQFWADEKVASCPWPEKLLLIYLLTNSELSNIGFIDLDLYRTTKRLNSKKAHAGRWKHRKPITEAEIKVALDSLRRRRIVLLESRGMPRVFITNYLKYARWSASVVAGWPRMIGRLDLAPKMEAAIRKSCVDFCERRSIEKPEGLARRR